MPQAEGRCIARQDSHAQAEILWASERETDRRAAHDKFEALCKVLDEEMGVPPMPETYEKLLEDSVEIAASPAEVWALVTDIPRMAKWSPQVVKSTVKGGEVKLDWVHPETANPTRRLVTAIPGPGSLERLERKLRKLGADIRRVKA